MAIPAPVQPSTTTQGLIATAGQAAANDTAAKAKVKAKAQVATDQSNITQVQQAFTALQVTLFIE